MNCLELDINSDDVIWGEEMDSLPTNQIQTRPEPPETTQNNDENDDETNSTSQIQTQNQRQQQHQRQQSQSQRYQQLQQHLHQERPTFQNLKLSYSQFQMLKNEGKNIIFVDIQFVGSEVVEIAVCRPDLPIVFHDAYPLCQMFKFNRPMDALTQMPHKNPKLNLKTIEYNFRYVNMNCCEGKNKYHHFIMKNNRAFYESLPTNDAIYILRGINKHMYWQELLQFYKKSGVIYLFWEKFYNPNLDRLNNTRGQQTCLYHSNTHSACSLTNVRQMALFYDHCKYMFF